MSCRVKIFPLIITGIKKTEIICLTNKKCSYILHNLAADQNTNYVQLYIKKVFVRI